MPFSVRIAGFNDIIEMSNLLNDIIIEGGSKTLNSFIKANLWDEAHIYKGSAAVSYTHLTLPTILLV